MIVHFQNNQDSTETIEATTSANENSNDDSNVLVSDENQCANEIPIVEQVASGCVLFKKSV